MGAIYYLSKRPQLVEEVVVRAPAPVLPPYEEAVKRLRGLEKESNLNDLQQIKPYYVELTDILRTYLGRRLNINAMESTSKELMQDMQRLAKSSSMGVETLKLLRPILHVSDLVKFADMHPRPDTGEKAMEETHKVLESVEKSLKPPPPVASPVPAAEEQNVEHVHDG